jgi:hypothetical protein
MSWYTSAVIKYKWMATCFALLLPGCGNWHLSVPSMSASNGVTASLSAVPDSLTPPQSTTLIWKTTSASQVTIDGLGIVPANGSRLVTPTQTSTYHLRALGNDGTAEAIAIVSINTVREIEDANGVRTWAVIPAAYAPGTRWPWVIYNHGYGQYGSDIYTGPGEPSSLVQSLVSAGYIVIATNYRNINCWGNAACGEDLVNLTKVWGASLDLAPKPYVIAESMGGIVTWNAIAHGDLHPLAVVGIYPACNLAAMYRIGALRPSIEAAYDFTSPNQLATASAGFDPMLDAPSDFTSFPIMIWASYSDDVVVRSENEDPFAAAINAAGGSVVIRTTWGQHGDASNFDASAVIEFFSRNEAPTDWHNP